MRKTKFVLSTFFIILIISSIFTVTSNGQIITNELPNVNSCSDCIGIYEEGDFVELNTFPVNLPRLFWEDDPIQQANHLNAIGNFTYGWMMTPWGAHFVSNHREGADKWYISSERHPQVFVPHDGILQHEITIRNGTVIIMNSTEVVVDIKLYIDIGNDCAVQFDHLSLAKNIFDEIQTTGTYTFAEGETLGYSHPQYSLDFHYLYKEQSICPYPAFSSTIQAQLEYYHGLQYERAKLCGLHPEPKLCNPYLVHMNDTLWGSWGYKSGPYDDLFSDNIWYGQYSVGFVTFLHRDFTDPATYWKHPISHENLTESILGQFSDGTGTNPEGFQRAGICLVSQNEGTNTEGIMELTTIEDTTWGAVNTTIYVKYQVDSNELGAADDLLTIEYFSSLTSAQAGFTENAIIYERYYPFWSNPSENFGCNIAICCFLGVSTLSVIIVIRKKDF